MQAVIAYDAKHLPAEERVGHIDRGVKEEGEVCESHDHDEQAASEAEESPVKFIK